MAVNTTTTTTTTAAAFDRLHGLLRDYLVLLEQAQDDEGRYYSLQELQTELEAELEATKDGLLGFYTSPKVDGAAAEQGKDDEQEIVLLDGLKHKLEPSFAKDSKSLAQILKVPFELAAQLLWQGLAQAKDFARSPAETAAALWHAYRLKQSAVWLLLLRYHQSRLEFGQNSCLSDWRLNEQDFFSSALLRSLGTLGDESQTNYASLGLNLFQDDLSALLEQERQLVGGVLVEYASIIPLSLIESEALIKYVSKLEMTVSSDRFAVAALLAVPATWQRHNAIGSKLFDETVSRVRRAMEASWTIETAQAACNLSWSICYYDLYTTHLDAESEEGSAGCDEAEALALESIRQGAVSFWNGFLVEPAKKIASRLVYQQPSFFYPDDQAYLITDDPAGQIQDPDLALRILEICRERLLALVVRLNSVLRKIRLAEEDLAIASTLYTAGGPVNGAGHERTDLADIISTLATLHRKQPDLASEFWAVNEDEYHQQTLYGFLRWAADCTAAPVIRATYDLLASLAAGEQCASGVYQFLAGYGGQFTVEEDDPLGLQRSEGTCSWQHITQILQYYKNAFSTTNRDYSASITPHDEQLLIAMLRVVEEVATWSQDARKVLWSSTNLNLKDALLVLISSNVSLDLKGAIVDTISSFALTSRGQEDIRVPIVSDLIGQFVPTILPLATSQQGNQGIALELEEVETLYQSYPYTLGFIRYLTRILRDMICDASASEILLRCHDFVNKQVFDRLQNRQYAIAEQQWMLAEACLRFNLILVQTHSELQGSASERMLYGFRLSDMQSQPNIVALLQISPGTLSLLKEDLYVVACLALSISLLKTVASLDLTSHRQEVEGSTQLLADDILTRNPLIIINLHLFMSPTSPIALVRAAADLFIALYSNQKGVHRTPAQARAFASKVARILSESDQLELVRKSLSNALTSLVSDDESFIGPIHNPMSESATGSRLLQMLILALDLDPESNNVTKVLLGLDGSDDRGACERLMKLIEGTTTGTAVRSKILQLYTSLAKSTSCREPMLSVLRSEKVLKQCLEDILIRVRGSPKFGIDITDFTRQLLEQLSLVLELYALVLVDSCALGLSHQLQELATAFFSGLRQDMVYRGPLAGLAPLPTIFHILLQASEVAIRTKRDSLQFLEHSKFYQISIRLNNDGAAEIFYTPLDAALSSAQVGNELSLEMQKAQLRFNASSRLESTTAEAWSSWTKVVDLCLQLTSSSDQLDSGILLTVVQELLAAPFLYETVEPVAAFTLITLCTHIRAHNAASFSRQRPSHGTVLQAIHSLIQLIARRELSRKTRAYLYTALIDLLSLASENDISAMQADRLKLVNVVASDAFDAFDLCTLTSMGLLDTMLALGTSENAQSLFGSLDANGHLIAMGNTISALSSRLHTGGLYYFSALLNVIARLSCCKGGPPTLHKTGILSTLLKIVFKSDSSIADATEDRDTEELLFRQSTALKILAIYRDCQAMLPVYDDLALTYFICNQSVILGPFQVQLQGANWVLKSGILNELALVISFLASQTSRNPKATEKALKETKDLLGMVMRSRQRTSGMDTNQTRFNFAALSLFLALTKNGDQFTPVLSSVLHEREGTHLSLHTIISILDQAASQVLHDLQEGDTGVDTAMLVALLEIGSVLLLAHLEHYTRVIDMAVNETYTPSRKDPARFSTQALDSTRHCSSLLRQCHDVWTQRLSHFPEAQVASEKATHTFSLDFALSTWQSINAVLNAQVNSPSSGSVVHLAA